MLLRLKLLGGFFFVENIDLIIAGGFCCIRSITFALLFKLLVFTSRHFLVRSKGTSQNVFDDTTFIQMSIKLEIRLLRLEGNLKLLNEVSSMF